MTRTATYNAARMRESVLEEAGGDIEVALWIACEEWARCWQLKGSGIDREGGPRYIKPNEVKKYQPEPIITTGGQ